MGDYKVSFPELTSGADGFENMERTAQSLLNQLNGVNLTQPDFGRVPWLQTRVFEAYSEHTEECKQVLGDLTDALGNVGAGLDGCAEAYQQMEEDAAQALGTFFAAVTA